MDVLPCFPHLPSFLASLTSSSFTFLPGFLPSFIDLFHSLLPSPSFTDVLPSVLRLPCCTLLPPPSFIDIIHSLINILPSLYLTDVLPSFLHLPSFPPSFTLEVQAFRPPAVPCHRRPRHPFQGLSFLPSFLLSPSFLPSLHSFTYTPSLTFLPSFTFLSSRSFLHLPSFL